MTPDRLRLLDRFLGVPLCALLSAARRVAAGFRRRSQGAGAPRKLLFIQLAEAGSMVLADPAVRRAEARGLTACFVTFAENAPALALTGTVPPERIYAIRNAGLPALLVDVWRLRRWARARGIDAVVDLELFSRLSAVLAAWTGASQRAGFHAEEGGALYRGHLFTAPVRFNPHQHMAKNYLRLLASLLDGPVAEVGPFSDDLLTLQKTSPSVAAERQVTQLLAEVLTSPAGRLVLVNANASQRLPQRRWPVESFAALIEQLLAIRPDVTVLLIGSADDATTTQRLVRQVGRIGRLRCRDIAGRLPIEALPALFARAALLVSNDSGPAHFAAASELPVLVLFGPETPTLFAPLGPATVLTAGLACSPCVSPANQRKSPCRDNRCMQLIAVETVLEASLRTLATECSPQGRATRACSGWFR